jgi:murein DD-endopeptidase MepM/ murein hydrolase activator NlpD
MKPPLEHMLIRTAEDDRTFSVGSKLNSASSPIGGAFGMVRKHGHKPHQGWDLYAPVATPVFAIVNGTVEFVRSVGDYGLQLCVKFANDESLRAGYPSGLYAFYGHLLSASVSKHDVVHEGQQLALSGVSGNAGNTPPHLHFEIRTVARPSRGLTGRIDPGSILGYQYYSCSG